MSIVRRLLRLRMVRDYGIAFALIAVCAYLAVATREKSGSFRLDSGAVAQIQREITAAARGQPGSCLLLYSSSDATQAQVANALSAQAHIAIKRVDGTPRDVRNGMTSFQADNGTSRPLAIIVLSPELQKHVERTKGGVGMGEVPVIAPPQRVTSVFLKYDNLVLNVASNIAVYGIMAVGMTFVILTAGIDLSVGSLIALVSVLAGMAMMTTGEGGGWHPRFASPVVCATAGVVGGLIAGALAGGMQGAIITRFGVPPFIATLAMMQMAKGFALHITQAGTIPDLPESFRWIGNGFMFRSFLGERLPVPVFLMLTIYLAAWLVLTRTTFGRYVYAVGGNEEAARLSGVPVRLVKFSVYVISGLTAAVGGIILTARLATGSARYGEGYELYVIAAAVVGGTSLFGGQGKILGTLLGALFIAVVNNGLNLLGVSSYVQIIVIGAVILFAVLFDQLKKRLS